jgi:hypothetical protein
MSEPSNQKIDLEQRARSRGDELRIMNEMRDADASRWIRVGITCVYLAIILIFSTISGYLIIYQPTNPHATTLVAILFFVMGAGIENIRQRILERPRTLDPAS